MARTEIERRAAEVWAQVCERPIVFARRNKAHDTKQWEVVRDHGGTIDDDTLEVLSRHSTDELAEKAADEADNEAIIAIIAAALIPSSPEGE
jgi:hypothetical protein